MDFEVHAEQARVASFTNGQDAMLFAHLLLTRGRDYVRVVDTEDGTAWRFEFGTEEMPVAVRETEA